MPSILRQDGNSINISVKYFEADTERDMWDIDVTNVNMGSRCYVINSGETFALNSNKEWKTVPSGGGGGYDPSKDYIWDGGGV